MSENPAGKMPMPQRRISRHNQMECEHYFLVRRQHGF
jgi:hypothetical protein